MKKKEAELLAVERVNIIFEYIHQILSDEKKVSSEMNFNTVKINEINMCTIDIYVYPDFEKRFNLNIKSDHINVLFKEFLNRTINNLLRDEIISVTKFYHFRSNTNLFDGIDIENSIGSAIKVNMYGINSSISNEYNKKYDEYKNNVIQNDISKKMG